jgi:hypothetical protein
MAYARRIQGMWEATTGLALEQEEYRRMWIRDVNNYIAENTEGKLKQKGAYWFPRKFPDDITNAGPPAWHKDFSAVVTIKAAVEHMVHGADIAQFVHSHEDKFDFMCRQKVDRSSRLMIGNTEVQRTTRYFVSTNGAEMKKISPPTGTPGTFKRKNGISDYEWHTILQSIPPGTHDERIHTKNKSVYTTREMAIEAGYKVSECNVASRFDFDYVNFDWYVDKARKLVI